MSALPKPSRRSMLAAAAMLAAPAASAVEHSALDELIADYRWAKQASEAASEAADALADQVDLPLPVVRYGKRRIHDKATGEVTWRQWEFSFDFEITRHFDRMIAVWENDRLQQPHVSALRSARDVVLQELRTLEAAREAAIVSSGLKAADAAADRACDQAQRLRDEIFAYRPVGMGEVAAKNAFLLEWMQGGLKFTDEELQVIFTAASNAK